MGEEVKFTNKVKEQVRLRTNMMCDRCLTRVNNPHYHHRKPRGMGGTKNITSGYASNTMLLHPSCHEWIEMHREASRDRGWLLYQHQNPAEVPIVHGTNWLFLHEDGSSLLSRPAFDEDGVLLLPPEPVSLSD